MNFILKIKQKVININKDINVFIVDDNKLFALSLKVDLENNFIDVPVKLHFFETGEKCMERFKEEEPEVVILDYHLNGKYPEAMDGIKILDWIKKQNQKTKVIILTCEDNIEIALKSFHHGASDYVVKTETKFRTINYSLLNLLKMVEAETYVRRYKQLRTGIFLCLALLVGAVIAVQIFI